MIAARAVVLTVGTFLGGRMHVGLESQEGGRAGDAPSNRLAARLRELPFAVGRLKTGTPPRLDGRTLDYAAMQRQPGDEPRPVFSFLGRREDHPAQLPCHITATNERTHEIIRGATDRSPMFTGIIEGVGPRYCPSVEDKVVRFATKHSHQVFVEPEGLDTHIVYPNGISTSLPADVQEAFVRSIRGFETGRDHAPRLCDRIRLLRSARAARHARDQAARAGSGSRARSTARRVTKRRRRRACSPASMRRSPSPGARAGRRGGTSPISACWWTT